MKNYGIDLEKEDRDRKLEDHIFGARSKECVAEIPEYERTYSLPTGEVQRGQEDFQDCATRAPLNILEAKLNWLIRGGFLPKAQEDFLRENGYVTKRVELSDRFVAMNSGTTRRGNSLIAPLDAIRKQGLIPKSMLPASFSMTWDGYHNPELITPKMRALGKEFLKHFSLNYERVQEYDMLKFLERDMIITAGYAWPRPIKGEYPRVERRPNHAWVNYKLPPFYAFDNYIDPTDGDFIKKLARNYDFWKYGYRLIIGFKTPKKKNWLRLWWDEWWA